MQKRKGTPLLEEEAMRFIVMLIIGLHYLHNQKERIHHRDLKPANILVFQIPNGSIILKIADFGISKLEFQTIINS